MPAKSSCKATIERSTIGDSRYFYTTSSGKLLEVVRKLFEQSDQNPEFLLHVFDDKFFVFTYFLVFTR